MKACTTHIDVATAWQSGLVPATRITIGSDYALTVERAIEIVTDKGYDVMTDAEGGCCTEHPAYDDVVCITVWPTVDLDSPWTGQRTAVSMRDLESKWDALVNLMDDDVREALHDQGIDYMDRFWAEYVAQVGPEAAGAIWYS
jgi:hypothetical protein